MDIINRLKSDSHDLWNQILRNEFVSSIVAGTLPVKGLREYVRQDYLYTIEFTKSLALLASRSNNEADLRHWIGMASFGADMDLPMHKRFAKALGVSELELEDTAPNTTTVGYNNYLRHIANRGAIIEFGVACLPCVWSYGLVAKRILSGLGVHYHVKGHGLDLWKTYNSARYKESVERLKNIIRAKSKGPQAKEYSRLTSNFRRSCRYELDFWKIPLS
jgi:thiaminase/transcriptional activator TenA